MLPGLAITGMGPYVGMGTQLWRSKLPTLQCCLQASQD